MSIGMSYDDYWFANPYLVQTYYEAHKLSIEQKNQEMWMQGLYFGEAIKSTICNAFLGKGAKKMEYPKQPFDIFQKNDLEKEREAEREREKAIKLLMRHQTKMTTKFSGDTKCQ